MKLWIIVLLSLLLITACGKPKEEETDSMTIQTEEGHEVKVAKDTEGSLSVPDNFPEDVVPVYGGARIITSTTDNEGTSHIIAISEDSMEEVIEFYNKALAGGEDLVESKTQDTYMIMGMLEGYNYVVTVADADEASDEYEGYESMFTLTVMAEEGQPDQTEPDETAMESEEPEEVDIAVSSGLSWPDNYPEHAIPAYKDGDPQVTVVMDMGEAKMVAFVTKDELEEVIAFYESALENAENLTSMTVPEGASFAGAAEGVSFQIGIFKNEDMDTYPGYATGVTMNYADIAE